MLGSVSTRVAHQPNVPGQGIVASYGPRFWALVVAIGAGAGLAGAALMELLRAVERLAWPAGGGAADAGGAGGGTAGATFTDAVRHATIGRHLVVLALGGLIAGAGVLLIRRLARGRGPAETTEALWLHDGVLRLPASLARGVLSIVTVGMGAALGREGAPQLAGAALASRAAAWAGLPPWQRRLLVACGAGAGMAAVYDVPLGGALFALEVLLGTFALPLVLPALATSLTATAVAWVALPAHAVYRLPHFQLTASQVVWAALAGPLAGLAAVLWVRLVDRATRLRPTTPRARLLAPIAVFAALGAASIAAPQLLGNGLDVVQGSLLGQLSVGLLAVLLVLRPLATAACLGSGSPGGLFTPTLAYGVLLGGLLGHAWGLVWPGAAAGSYALVGGAAVLAAAMQGPLAAIVLAFELTRASDALMVPVLLAIVGATVVARLLRADSIYSARLPAYADAGASAAAAGPAAASAVPLTLPADPRPPAPPAGRPPLAPAGRRAG